MIPTDTEFSDELMSNIDSIKIPSGGWKMTSDFTKCLGKNSGLDELKQCIYFMLGTERDQHILYNYDYGLQTLDLIGQPADLIAAQLQSRITETLLNDDRILNVTDFSFSKMGKRLTVEFTVQTNLSDFTMSTEVEL